MPSTPHSSRTGGLADRLLRARNAFWLRAVSRQGRDAELTGRPLISNSGFISIGDGFCLSSCPVQSHMVAAQGARIEIGARVLIAYGAAISSHLEVTIGDDAQLGPFAVIMDSDFHVAGDRNATAEPSPIRIGKRVVIGARVTILRGSTLGDDARVSSGAVVSGHVPAGSVVGGVPARPLSQGPQQETFALPDLVMRVLGLPELPSSSAGPEQIPAWDSLGSLKLLLALEETYGVTLGEEELKSARSVGRLIEIVDAARARRGQGADAGAA